MNDMNELNIDLDDYKLNELFDLASWLHNEEFPSSMLNRKKKMVIETIANQLTLETKEVVWMLEAKEEKKLKVAMIERERENAAVGENNKNWELLTREVKTITNQNVELQHQNEIIIQTLKKLEAKTEQQ